MTEYVVTTLTDELDADTSVETPGGSGLSLREAIALAGANAGADRITFASALGGGTIRLDGTLDGVAAVQGRGLFISQQLTIVGDVDGDGDADIAIDGGLTAGDGLKDTRIFFVDGGSLRLEGLTLQNGFAKGGNGGGGDSGGGGGMGAGGAVFVRQGASLTLRDVTLDGNRAQGGNGGADLGSDLGGGGGGGMVQDGGNGSFVAQSSSSRDYIGGSGGGAPPGSALALGVGGAGGAGYNRNGSIQAGEGQEGGYGAGGGGDSHSGSYAGGSGGFGGGSGGSRSYQQGYFSSYGGGVAAGAGAGFGGGVFAMTGSTLVLERGVVIEDNTVARGSGGADVISTPMQAQATGAGVFLHNTTLTVAPAAGETVTLTDVIGDASYVAGTGWITHSSTGTLNKVGQGALVLVADNTYGWVGVGNYRTTTVSAGVLQLGAGGTTGSILTHVSLAAGSTLVVDRSNTLTIDRTISGAGGLVQQGEGVLILNATNSYTGATTVANGILRVNGSVAGSAFTVQDGATLMGTGTTGALTVLSGGSVSAGASPGTLTTGALTLEAGSTLLAELQGSAAGSFDRLMVTGGVALGGSTLNLQLLGGYAPATGTAFTLIANDGAEAVVGTFAGLAEGATITLGSVSFGLTYRGGDGNDVALIVNKPPVNTAPFSVSAIEDVVLALTGASLVQVAEGDGSPVSVVLTASAGTLDLTAAAGASLVEDGRIATVSGTVTAVNATLESLTYTGAANAFGGATLTVVSSDGSGAPNARDTDVIAIDISPVNDAPTLRELFDVGVQEDSGRVTLAGFAAGLTAGPANEGGQSVTLSVTSDNPALFASGPTLVNGRLSFTPAANASGVATLTVTASDDGGTANGGVDAASRTFTVTVEAVNDLPVAVGDLALVVGDAASGNVLTNDSDVEGALTVAGAQGAGAFTPAGTTVPGAYGVLSLAATGAWSYAFSGDGLLAGDLATDVFAYAVADANGGVASASLVLGVEGRSVGGAGDDVITGGARDNRISGLGGADRLAGGEGDDRLDGGVGNDVLDGGEGIDTVSYAAATAAVAVSLAAARQRLADGVDTLIEVENVTGSAFADTLSGNAGDNVVEGGAGDDVLTGGLGADLLKGGEGLDTARYADAPRGVRVDLRILVAQDTVGAGWDTLDGIEHLRGSGHADVLKGSGGAETLQGGGGDDELFGFDAADRLEGQAGNDALFGGDGADLLLGSDGLDTLDGGADPDRLYGGLDGDALLGAAGDDSLYGEAGNDRLTGGLGADALFGGAGADTFAFAALTDSTVASDGRDRIGDFSRAEGDRIDLSALDAVAGGADDAFVLVAAFTGTRTRPHPGELVVKQYSTYALIQGDVDGNGAADFSIYVQGTPTLTSSDFVL